MRRAPLRIAVAALCSVLAAGCMVGPDFIRPVAPQPVQFKSEATAAPAVPVQANWWSLYGDPELDQLIATAYASNQTLQQAVARVDLARALARVAGSYLYPTIS